VLGALATTWINGSRMAATLFGDTAATPGWGDNELAIRHERAGHDRGRLEPRAR